MSFVIGPNTKPEDAMYWYVTGKNPHANQAQPNCMNRIVQWMRDDQVATIKKVGMLAIGILATLTIGWLVGKTLLVFSAVTLISTIWAKREAAELDAEENRKIQEVREAARSLEAQNIAFGKVKLAIMGDRGDFDQIPVLDIGERMGPTGSIDFIKPNEINVGATGHDKFGRPFVALNLRTIPQENEAAQEDRVLVIFQRYTEGGSWTYSFPDKFMNEILGDADLAQITQIIEANHPRYRLVPMQN